LIERMKRSLQIVKLHSEVVGDGFRENASHGGSPDLVAQDEDDISKLGVSPTGVFLRKSHHQISDVLRLRWTARPTLSAAVVLRTGVRSEPTTQSVRGDERTNFPRSAPGKGFRFQREATTLTTGESQTLTTKHLAQHLGFFSLVGDNRLLMSVDPTGKHQQ
jgi:hypothetical protein